MNKNGFAPIILILVLVILFAVGFFLFNKFTKSPAIVKNPQKDLSITYSNNPKSSVTSQAVASLRSGIPFEVIIKSVKSQVLGEATSTKKIPVQIYAYEDTNGNGVREPGENALAFMPVNIYDSPFSESPINKISSTDSGWAGVLLDVGSPYQLVVSPAPTKDYVPTTKSIIVSEKNNFAVLGYEKKQEVSFHISVFAFLDVNKDSNYNYDDKNEKPLFLAPFKFYQQKEDGSWELLPNSVNSTDTGWATTTVTLKYPYKVKVEAGDLDNLTPSNREAVISQKDATLIFPYLTK